MASRGIPNFQNGREKGLTFVSNGSRWSKKTLYHSFTLWKYKEDLFPKKAKQILITIQVKLNPNYDINYNQSKVKSKKSFTENIK